MQRARAMIGRLIIVEIIAAVAFTFTITVIVALALAIAITFAFRAARVIIV
jgi:hypothetical protein